jgi:tRNA pseudouridine-54 N-methylase
MQSSRCTYHLSGEVESFYEQQDQCFDKKSTHLSVGYDGKGIPIRRAETERAQESVATRLSKGQKRDVKREATVSVSSCFTAQKRSVEQIIESLFFMAAEQSSPEKDIKQKKHCWHEQKHIRAFLSDKQKAIRYGIDDLLKRDKTASKPIIVLMDGDRALEKAVKKVVEEKKITHRVDAYILDFIHLLEYVWKVANARWGEKHPGREDWVKAQAILLLNSEWKEVLAQWQEILDTQKLSNHQVYNVQRAITYVSNRPHMLDYKSYLDKGYRAANRPITTGAVESACGHFVKSRMERNAMHWGKQGAQEMLNIRAVKKNGDWQEYTQHFIDHEQQQLYQRAA